MVRSEPSKNTPTASKSEGDALIEAAAEAAGIVLWQGIRLTVRLVWWAVLFPMLSLPVAMSVAVGVRDGWPAGAITAAGFLLLLVGWRLAGAGSFRRCVSGRVWKRWRRWSVYRRPWAQVCALHGLSSTLNDAVLIPALRRVRVGYVRDVVTVRMLTGQSLSGWQAQSDAFAHTFGAMAVQITSPTPGWVTITVHHHDSLATPLALPTASPVVDLERVPVGVTEAGRPWLVRLLGRHVLIGGATGAGKGSVVWSLIAGIAPAIRAGVVQLWVIDPKGGMEFGAGAGLYARFAHDTGEQTLSLLRDAAAVLTDRAARLRGVTRQHTPTAAEPLIVVVIDEAASLTAYVTDRKIRAEVEQVLGLILSQGRAVGVSVIACVQDPSKEVMGMRQLFPTRVGLRLAEASQVAMILGQGARERGAVCDLISDQLPGVGYVTDDTATTVVRVRAFHVTDDDISALTRHYRRPAPVATDDNSQDGDGDGGGSIVGLRDAA